MRRVYSGYGVYWRTTSFLPLVDNSADRGKPILYAVFELGVQGALVLLRSLAAGDIDVDGYHPLRMPIFTLRNRTASLDPSNLAV